MYYQGKHHKKRFGPTLDKYKTQLIFYWICFKQKIFPIFDWFGSLMDCHDEWWDSIEEKWEHHKQKLWLLIGYKAQKIADKFGRVG